MYKDYPANQFQSIVGRKIEEVNDAEKYDEGLDILLDNGDILHFHFSGCEGLIVLCKKTGEKNAL